MPLSASCGTSCLGESPLVVMTASTCAFSLSERALPGACNGPQRRSSPSGRIRHRSTARTERPMISSSSSSNRDSTFLLRTRSAAASASAFSLRASSRSSLWILLLVAFDARPSSSSDSRHCSSSARRSPFLSRKDVSSWPVSFVASARIWIFSSTDHVLVFLGGGTRGRLRASSSQRESVVCGTPISCSSLRALIASLPIRRWTILPLKAGEKGFVTASSHPRPGGSGIEEGDNYPGAGGPG